MIPVRAKSFRWHWNRIKLATGCSSVSQSALSWAPTCAHPTDELAVSALFCCAFRVLTADPSHSISDASNIMKRDCVRPVVDRLQAEDGDDQKRCFERFFYCWCMNPAPMLLPPTPPSELVQGAAMSTAAVMPFRSFVQTPIFSVSPSSFSLQRI